MTKRERFEQLVKQLVDSGFSTKLAISVASKTLGSEQVKVERGENESLQQCVSRGISKLMSEGMDQDQAIAAAYSMCQIEPKAYNPDQVRDEHGRWTGGGSNPSSQVRDETRIVVGNEPVRISEGGPTASGPTYANPNADKPKVEPYERNIKPIASETILPGENTNFSKVDGLKDDPDLTKLKGSDITKSHATRFNSIANREIAYSLAPSMEKFKKDLEADGIKLSQPYKIRAKDPESLQEKMNGKWKDKTLDQVTDGLGGRMVFDNQRDADKALLRAKSKLDLKVLEHSDKTNDPKGDGYRANHLLVRTKSGMVAELQIKTVNQDRFSKWTHDDIYKNPKLKDHPDVKTYTSKVSEYLHKLDTGKEPGDFPKAPKVVKDAKMEYDTSKILTDPYAKR